MKASAETPPPPHSPPLSLERVKETFGGTCHWQTSIDYRVLSTAEILQYCRKKSVWISCNSSEKSLLQLIQTVARAKLIKSCETLRKTEKKKIEGAIIASYRLNLIKYGISVPISSRFFRLSSTCIMSPRLVRFRLQHPVYLTLSKLPLSLHWSEWPCTLNYM